MSDSKVHQEATLFPLPPAEPESLTIGDVAARANVHPRTVQKWLQANKIRRLPTGEIDPESVNRWLTHRAYLRPSPGELPRSLELLTPEEQLLSLLRRVSTLEHEMRVMRQRFADELDTALRLVHVLEQDVDAARKRERDAVKREVELLTVVKTLTTPDKPHKTQVAGSLRARIISYLRQEGRAMNAQQIRHGLQLDISPSRTLNTLAAQGVLTRIKPGVFSLIDTALTDKTLEALPGVPLVQRILDVIQHADRPLRTAEIRKQLRVARDLRQELSQLCNRGEILRIRPGVFHHLETPHPPAEEEDKLSSGIATNRSVC